MNRVSQEKISYCMMYTMRKCLALLAVTAASLSASASGCAPAESVISANQVTITRNDIIVAGQTAFSLKEWLQGSWGGSCRADLKATALSFADPLLSVQVEGELCGEYISTVEVIPTDGSGRLSVSDLFGEAAVIAALKRDPYLNRAGQLQGTDIYELEASLGENNFSAACPLSGVALNISQEKYAFWEKSRNKVGVRLALPMRCGGTIKDNSFEWLGLVMPTDKLQLPVQFYATERPESVAHLQW